MRVIAGEFRGRKLLPPEGSDVTRPITDRVKQSLFDILAPEIEGAYVYDLFAGTGSIGLESLSRGAAGVTFFEADRSALGRLRRNVATLGVAGRATVVGGDLFEWVQKERPREKVHILFLDPPYSFLRERAGELQRLASNLVADHLAPAATVVFRHDARDALELPPLVTADRREYGGMVLEFLRNLPIGPGHAGS